jgi:hypothetical protein
VLITASTAYSLQSQGRQVATDKIKELSRKQLEEACVALENQVSNATDSLAMVAQTAEPAAHGVAQLVCAFVVNRKPASLHPAT